MKLKTLFIAAALAGISGLRATAADAYFKVQLNDLDQAKFALPAEVGSPHWQEFRRIEQMSAYVVLDGQGEAFVEPLPPELPGTGGQFGDGQRMVLCVPDSNQISGRLFVPKPDLTGMLALPFKAPPGILKPLSREKFLETKEAHYQNLSQRNLPGTAWFRHEAQAAAIARGGKPLANRNGRFWRPEPQAGLDETFGLFSGGRAISENLQLDRDLLATKPGDETVALTNLTGITVKAMDWKPLLTNSHLATDTLAAAIPADQHAVFFHSFQAMTEMLDEADGDGTPLLQFYETRSEDADCRGRYQRQLCLGLNEISRRFGPEVINSAAFTGSDPYLRTGSDVGVLFETSKLELLKTFIGARQAAALQESAENKAVKGEINGIAYVGVVSADRAVSSYVASSSNVVFVCNSLYQLGRLIDVATGKTPALVSQDDYLYFRTRYPRGADDESAFLVLPDAAIRRWCGAEWRIGTSRRTRASALLADLQASNLVALVKGQAASASAAKDKDFPDAGEIRFTSHGVLSSVYGNLNFLTPIGEMNLSRVTKAEADAYGRWRDTYQQNWSQFFDPIAARFSLRPDHIGVDVTVMPLILRTEYKEFAAISTGAGIAQKAGDPHAEALAHFALSINTESPLFNEAGGFLHNMSPLIKANPLSWMGQSLALFADEDPFWDKLEKSTNKDTFWDKNLADLPVAFHCEVKDSLGLVVFLTALHSYIDQSAPGMAVWQNLEHNGRPYVKIVPQVREDEPPTKTHFNIYYAASPGALTVTLNENVLKHALDRKAAKAAALKDGKPLPQPPAPWLGSNLCFKVDHRFLTMLANIFENGNDSSLQILSWNNLPILNEWKRRFPNEDPVKLHERYWQTKLVCPGGGAYVWNEKWQTMESTVYGCPAAPKEGPKLALMPDMKDANLGLGFENNGISARAVVNRTPKPH